MTGQLELDLLPCSVPPASPPDPAACWIDLFAAAVASALAQLADYLEHPDPRETESPYPRDLYDEWFDDQLTGR